MRGAGGGGAAGGVVREGEGGQGRGLRCGAYGTFCYGISWNVIVRAYKQLLPVPLWVMQATVGSARDDRGSGRTG